MLINHARWPALAASTLPHCSQMSTFLTPGVNEIGILIASVLYGVTTLQAGLYAENCSADKSYLRIMVSIFAYVV